MIATTVNTPFVAFSSDAPTGLVGTIGVRVLDPLGNEAVARTTDGITEMIAGSGLYKWESAGLPAPGAYLLVWDTSGDPPLYADEELQVAAAPAPAQAPATVGRPTPDLAGFAAAQDRKRALIGADVTFLGKPQVTFPPGTAINPDTGDPYDPTVAPSASAQTSAMVRCGVYFRAIVRGAGGEAAASPAGWEEVSRIVVLAPYSAKDDVDDKIELVFHDERFKIHTIKDDEVVAGYKRILVYASAI